jgi:outer membrane murein-binding lipoprotein Lpp
MACRFCEKTRQLAARIGRFRPDRQALRAEQLRAAQKALARLRARIISK